MIIHFLLNERHIEIDAPPDRTLLRLLRESLKLTGAKPGCEDGHCGACSVLVDGTLQKSCLLLVKNLEGRSIVTIEGLESPQGEPNDMQIAFLENGAFQCGYCTPGMILAGEALLRKNPLPTREEIRQAIADNLCRCTGYQQIVDAIEATAKNRAQRGVYEQPA